MVLLDTDIFVIDRFFQRDVRYPTNQALIDCLPRIDAGFSAFSLFELCGIASFRMSPTELRRWSYNFDEVYGVKVLEPKGIDTMLAMSWFARFSYRVLGIYERKMTLGGCRASPYRRRLRGRAVQLFIGGGMK